ncbi:hypothetical protein Y1Q_0001026 [Alligator mississippiensis]|uniref:Uncharacterized protein n=1 Tax=Alligator mississippiensis TaxID=8496 RepID=A0A151NER5_ALLMI|nr:hypothetical protein Y1Q_0001026 [Alligator mississippiensis]
MEILKFCLQTTCGGQHPPGAHAESPKKIRTMEVYLQLATIIAAILTSVTSRLVAECKIKHQRNSKKSSTIKLIPRIITASWS